jgi:four helix bundle protein
MKGKRFKKLRIMEEKQKIKSFTDLDAWKEGHTLVLMVYKCTRTFPKEEVFALVNQMRRCVVSITSNIAEGFGRQSFKEKVQFYYISQGSLTELQNQLLIARDVEFITKKDFSPIAEQTVKVQRIINGLIKKTKSYL